MRQDEWLKKKMNVDVHQYTRDIAKLGFKPLYFPKRAVIKVDDYLLDLTEGTITLKGKRVCEYTGKKRIYGFTQITSRHQVTQEDTS